MEQFNIEWKDIASVKPYARNAKKHTEIVEDEPPEVDEEHEPICKLGDIWQLGRHRLICGDSTDRATVERLMDGAKADFDLFGWSGSTLIACEQLGRVCYMCEISTLFCDVIIKRWENFTGQKAVKIS